jgi:gliding motility-associated-like protein
MFIFTTPLISSMKKYLLLLIVLILSLSSYAQGEANIWYFGFYAGLDFNSGSPVALADSKMNTLEGCATISNSAGQLLFYTDGSNVWNKNHQIMLNGTGLKGHNSSTQSSIIVPKPNSSSVYFIFTVDAIADPNGLQYSEVDLSLDGGLGAITSNKNILLVTPTCEKITAVKNATGDGYWVVAHGYNNNSFLAYSVTATGVNYMPVISNIGSLIDDTTETMGYLKISPDGSKLISCNNGVSLELFDFNNATGVANNPKLLNNGGGYSVEFSPSGNILYLTSGGQLLIQYDLTAVNISDSAIIIYERPNDYFSDYISGLQLASNGKIYCTIPGVNHIGAINNPNVLGIGCNFVTNVLSLGAGSGEFGLPQFIQSFFDVGINVQNNCLGETTSFSLIGNQTITSATWDFGDGNASTAINATHTYTSAGTYTVSVTATSTSGTSTKTRDIIISAIPTATKPQDLLICDSNNDGLYDFDLTNQNTTILNGQDSNLCTIKYFANATDYNNSIVIAKPNNYVNAVAYQQQAIIAEVSNKANGSCKSTTSFNIDVFDIPKPSTVIPKMSSCDNTSVGTDTDSRVLFDLTQNATAVLNGQSATQFVLSYYKDAALSQWIASPNAYPNTYAQETIYVKMTNKDNASCFATTSFPIEVLALPVITSTVDLKQCDDNIDGFSVFNLEEAIEKISTNAANETIAFFRTPLEAKNNSNPITNTTTYTNQTVSNDGVYARVTNTNGCFRIAKLNLIVSTTQIPVNYSKSFTECDDAFLGTNTDGIASFDFSGVTAEIQNIFPAGQLLDIRYFRNLADALAEKNAITDISNYRNIGYPNTQQIYIRVDSQVNNDCLGLGNHITLNVERIPIVQALTQIHCDDDQDGKYAFDTTNLQTQLLNGLTNVSVAYFDQNSALLSTPLPNPFLTASQTLKVVVTNNATKSCSYNSTIQFVVDDLPEAFAVPSNLTTICDDEADPSLQNGKYAFDTTTFQNTILGGQTGMTVKYFDTNNNLLFNSLPNPFVTATQNLKVEVINPKNTTCIATVTLPFVVNPVPKIALTGNELVCSDLPTFTKDLDAGLLDGSSTTNYTYAWSFNGNTIAGETNYTLTVNTAGLYTVKVTNTQGCFRTRTFTVVASDKANITDVKIVDLAESNSITVSVAASLGEYVYALDDENGSYQTDNVFTNVSAGIHTIFVKDLNGCGIKRKEVAVLGIPNFFTPNNDGNNDYWNIKGVNASFNANTIIYIFDRYGKLVKQISPQTQGWDGTFNGQQMPASDYWYSIQLEDGRVEKGHFALKR